MRPKFENIDLKVKFFFGKYEGETLEYVYENDIQYLQYLKENKVLKNKKYRYVPINNQGRKLVRTQEFLDKYESEKDKVNNTVQKTLEEAEEIYPDEASLVNFLELFDKHDNKQFVKYDGSNYIYILENIVTDHIYIGYSKNKRNVLQRYKDQNYCYYSNNDFEKYGVKSFKLKFIKYDSSFDISDVKDEIIIKAKVSNFKLYNNVHQKLIDSYFNKLAIKNKIK